MVHNNVAASSNSNSEEENNGDVEFKLKNLPAVPPGFHFVPSSCLLILDYLVKKIVGVPLASDMVKVRDGIQQLDPEQHRFKDEFAHCQDNEAYYITNKGQRKTIGGGGSETSTIIETTSGYWEEKKKDIPIYNGDNLIGYKKRYVFCRGKNDETFWRLDEFIVNPEIIPVNSQDKIEDTIACTIRVKRPKTSEGSSNEYEDFEEEDAKMEDFMEDEEMEEVVDEN
ncbi:hypothetical protein POM88_031009 [Heracleum sosnowskyi]|uniref:NAC domain-containing protein n=1 Tax=Heracleum sosnowskyi TaxID=360622 RepID=A0AAD8HZJ6_9APIA|nr:hypothetical protein POM88_031008 [Heracleum sosnowskyi]KAK1374816.1 hypothetical protein POM88_031009 [Heracleum sosnowskyi]